MKFTKAVGETNSGYSKMLSRCYLIVFSRPSVMVTRKIKIGKYLYQRSHLSSLH